MYQSPGDGKSLTPDLTASKPARTINNKRRSATLAPGPASPNHQKHYSLTINEHCAGGTAARVQRPQAGNGAGRVDPGCDQVQWMTE
jgi:hypothetical protein